MDGSSTRNYGGTGLGTTISKQFVELMSGKIWVESEEGAGSSFHFEIPFRLPEEYGKSPGRNGAVFADKKRGACDPLKILLAEDSVSNAKLIKTVIESKGSAVDVAENGMEAIEMWEKGNYDLILMDIQMSEMNGYEAARLIRDKEEAGEKRAPIIAVTAHAMEGEKKCLEAGMDGFITKPVDFKELFREISNVRSNCISGPLDK